MSDRVVTLLGTNGTFSQKQLDEYIRILGEDRELYFVTIFAPVKWNNEVNQQLHEAKIRHANVHIIDWYEFAKKIMQSGFMKIRFIRIIKVLRN